MYYYDGWFFFLAALLVLILSFVLQKKTKQKTWQILCSSAALLIVGTCLWSLRTERNLGLYDTIVQSDKIAVSTDTERCVMEFSFEHEGYVWFENLERAPVYAKKQDFTELCRLEFLQAEEERGVAVKLCRLEQPEEYPDYAKFYYQGKCYCFLSEKFLYNNAFFLLNEEYAQKVLETVLP